MCQVYQLWLTSAPASSVGKTAQNPREEKEKILKKLWNYFGKGIQEHLTHWRRHPEVNDHPGIAPQHLFLTDHWRKFFFFLFFNFFFFPFSITNTLWIQKKKQKESFKSFFIILYETISWWETNGRQSIYSWFISMSRNLWTFFCIKQNENRRQQTFSLTLILLKSIT